MSTRHCSFGCNHISFFLDIISSSLPLSFPKSFFDLLMCVNPWWVGASRSDPTLNHAWPWCITCSRAWRRETQKIEDRREGCYPSPAAVCFTVDQWSSAFISQLQQSATWPHCKNCLSQTQSSLSPSKFSFSFCSSWILKHGEMQKKTHTICVHQAFP